MAFKRKGREIWIAAKEVERLSGNSNKLTEIADLPVSIQACY